MSRVSRQDEMPKVTSACMQYSLGCDDIVDNIIIQTGEMKRFSALPAADHAIIKTLYTSILNGCDHRSRRWRRCRGNALAGRSVLHYLRIRVRTLRFIALLVIFQSESH